MEKLNNMLLKLDEKIKNYDFNNNNITAIFFLLIVVVIPCSFLPYQSTQTNNLTLMLYLFVIVFVLFAINKYKDIKSGKKNKVKIKFGVADYSIIIYMILILISTLASNYTSLAIFKGSRAEGLITLYSYILLFYLAYRFFNFKEKYLKIIAVSTMILSIVGIVQGLVVNLSYHQIYNSTHLA